METVFRAWTDIPVTENQIKQLHRDLLRHSEKDERHRGEYKTVRNDVGAFDAAGNMIEAGMNLMKFASAEGWLEPGRVGRRAGRGCSSWFGCGRAS
ncbi:MAG: hypothetical protein ACLP1D_10895 [Xanthobacteraceae bacterium]